MPKPPKRPARDDLFAIFPDLPWLHPDRLVAKREPVQNQARRPMGQPQIRAGENIRPQRPAAGPMRDTIASNIEP
jgi:hypothetical protein